MSNNIHSIVRRINRELVPQFEERLRSYLAEQDKDWLIEQIVRLTLDAHSLQEMDRKFVREMQARRRAERADRVRALGLNPEKRSTFTMEERLEMLRQCTVGLRNVRMVQAAEEWQPPTGHPHRTPKAKSVIWIF